LERFSSANSFERPEGVLGNFGGKLSFREGGGALELLGSIVVTRVSAVWREIFLGLNRWSYFMEKMRH
jgi:hypothetical protein